MAFIKRVQLRATLWGFSISAVTVGREPTPATAIQVLLGDKGCNSTQIGGEASAYSLNDWRVLWLRKANS